jgi:hypothetical protein
LIVDSDTPTGTPEVPAVPRTAETSGTAGRLLAQLTVLPALLALSFLLVAFPLLLLGWFRPLPVAVLGVVAALIIVPWGMRLLRDRPAADPSRRTPWWTVAALVVVAAGFGVDQALYHSQYIFIARDPGSYLDFAAWIQGHGSLPIRPSAAPFGGLGSGGSELQFGSWANYPVGQTVVPQFMAGLPMTLAVGYWLGGVHAALLMAPLLGAAGVLTFGGLVARTVGPRWAPLAALALAVSLPDQYTARSTFSEPLSQLLFLGGLCLLLDALRLGPSVSGSSRARRFLAAPRALSGLAGLCLGINFLVRLDGPSDMLLVVPFAGYLLLRRRPEAVPLIVGFVAGLVYGTVDGVFLTWQYLQTNMASVKAMTVLFAAAVVVTAVAFAVLRRRQARGRRLWPRLPGWVPSAAAVLPFVAIAAFAVRPYVQTDYVKLADAQFSLHWVYWYAGGPVILAATIAVAVLIRRCLRGQAPDWVPVLGVFVWTSLVFLYEPAITPDQPWGSRRLVPAVLPGFFLLATWFAAWLTQKARGLRAADGPRKASAGRRAAVAVLAVVCALGLVVPAVKTTFNLRLHYVGGLRLTADGWATTAMYQGEVPAIQGLCAAIPPGSSVLFVSAWDADELMAAVRSMCGVPVASLTPVNPNRAIARPANVKAAIRRIEGTGRRPVLLAGSAHELKPYPNGTVKKIMTLKHREDQHAMNRPPTGSKATSLSIWMWEAK